MKPALWIRDVRPRRPQPLLVGLPATVAASVPSETLSEVTVVPRRGGAARLWETTVVLRLVGCRRSRASRRTRWLRSVGSVRPAGQAGPRRVGTVTAAGPVADVDLHGRPSLVDLRARVRELAGDGVRGLARMDRDHRDVSPALVSAPTASSRFLPITFGTCTCRRAGRDRQVWTGLFFATLRSPRSGSGRSRPPSEPCRRCCFTCGTRPSLDQLVLGQLDARSITLGTGTGLLLLSWSWIFV